jgi:hypothetical protein
MRVMVVVCGANGERSVVMMKAIEEFAKKYFDHIIQMSACTVAASPILIQMGGGDPKHLVAMNGCRTRCDDLIIRRTGMEPTVSVVLDEAIGRDLERCETCSKFVFPDILEEEWKGFAQMLGEVVEKAR